MQREIVIGYDREHNGEDVLRLGRVLSEVLASKPRVVTAVPWPDYLVGVINVESEMENELRVPFEQIRAEMSDLGVETEGIASRTPALALQEIAERDHAQVIVVGSCHHGPIGRTLAGSVGESLLHGASTAVAIAPHDYAERAQDRLQRIGVAFDGSSESWTALETAIGLAERCHGTLTAIAVADFPTYGYATTWTVLSAGDLRDAERTSKQRLLDLAVSRIPEGVERESRVLTGDPSSKLKEVSGEFDLLVAGCGTCPGRLSRRRAPR
jgi:nucleotide-binding universal stress UspA family protein